MQMRELVYKYVEGGLSRRGFLNAVAAMGYTAAAAKALLAPLQAAETTTQPGSANVQGTGGELVVAQARAAGVEYMFTNPGSFEVGLFDAWIDQPGLQMIMGLHEGIVIAMADGYHRVSRKPAFVNVHVIAGTAQMAGQLYNASRDGSALVITAGLNDNQVWSDEATLAPRPGFDQKEVARQFTKISWEARQAESLPLMLRRAFKVATTDPGGPVYLAMAHYALEKKGAKADILPGNRFMMKSRPRPDKAAVETAARLISEAKRPLLVVGDEVWKSEAQASVVALAELTGAAVAGGAQAYRNFPVRHPQYLGQFAMGLDYVKRGPDLVVMIGAPDFGGKLVPASPEAPDAKIVRIGMDTAAMGRNYATDVAMIGDVREGVDDLRAAIGKNAAAKARGAETREAVAAMRAKQEAEAAANRGQSSMHPDELGEIVARNIDPRAIVVSENLTGRYNAFPFGYREDEMTWISNTGLGLGWGVGAATGAKLAAPDREVVCAIGDGSVMYSASGFWSQARYHVPVLTIVWNNRNYQTVRHAYHGYRGKMAASGHYAGMYLGDPDIDFVKLAGSQGVSGEKAAGAAGVAAAIKRGRKALAEGRPYVIDAQIARFGGGAESEWHEKFSLASKRTKQV